MVNNLAIVKVDSQRRIYIPKELSLKAEKALIIPFGASFLLIPVPEKIIEVEVEASIPELKKRAEEKAKKEVTARLKRRA